MADIATGKMIRESAKTVAVSNGNIVITKNDGSTVNNTSNSLTVTASTQSAITPSTQYAFTTEGGSGAHNNMPPYIVKYCWERTG